MSTGDLKSIDKLRELCADVKSMDFASVGCDAVLEIADEIEQEIAEKYMELPVDADGVPIRVGDEIEREGQQFIVCAVAPAVIHSWAAGRKLGEGMTTVAYRPEDCRHFKPRTIEDVLEEFLIEFDDWDWNTDGNDRDNARKQLFAKYAAEIRELMGVQDD